jgi:phytoene dehydrogenase-like protein
MSDLIESCVCPYFAKAAARIRELEGENKRLVDEAKEDAAAVASHAARIRELEDKCEKAVAIWRAREAIIIERDAIEAAAIERCAKWLEDIPEHWRTLAADMRRSLKPAIPVPSTSE